MRYFLDTDNDGHWYLVPASRRDEWRVWTDLDPENPHAWVTPTWAHRIGGHPSEVVFILAKDTIVLQDAEIDEDCR